MSATLTPLTFCPAPFGALLGGRSGSSGVAGWDKEPKGKALVKVINAAVEYLEDSVPSRYYTEPPV